MAAFKGNREWMDKLEAISDQFYRKNKVILPHIARLCLLSMFFQEGVQFWLNIGYAVEYINTTFHVGYYPSTFFILLLIFSQIIPCIMILLRKRIWIAWGILCGELFLQTIAYWHWELQFLMRNLALAGGLMLLLVDARADEGRKRLTAGVPYAGNERNAASYLQLLGRIFVVAVFATPLLVALPKLEFTSIGQMVQVVLALSLITLVMIGYKTKLSALISVLLLALWNVIFNAFWMVPDDPEDPDQIFRAILRDRFFRTVNVIGGLLLIVTMGAGTISVDHRKKDS